MRTQRLVDIVLKSSVLAVPACCVDDCTTDRRDVVATRASYGTDIDDCLADADACRGRIADERRAAIATIVDGVGKGLVESEREVLGIPAPARLRTAASAMFAALG
jgi:hypothetical protein